MSARPGDRAWRIAKLVEYLPPGAQPTSENIMRYYGVVVHIVPGTPAVGLWCETCLLPSRYEVPLFVLDDEGPSRIGTVNRCDRCAA